MSLPSAETTRVTPRAAMAVIVAAGLVGAAGWGLRTLEWPIHDVRVDGIVAHADRAELKAVMARHARAGFFAVDLEALRTDLRALPWVRDASLRRIWPDTLDVSIREHAVAAHWNEAALVSRRGVVFEPPTPVDMEAPTLAGPAGQGAAMLERLRSFSAELEPLGLEVAALRQNERRDWRLELSNGVALRLGRDHMEVRLARFVAIWPRALASDAGRIASVDLRYPNGFAVTWRGQDADADAGTTRGGA
jgi:cell division protein FtsQ